MWQFLVSCAAGVLVTEIGLKWARSPTVGRKVQEARTLWRRFSDAKTDSERQGIILSSGISLLSLSVAALGILLLIGTIAFAVIRISGPHHEDQAVSLLAMSMAGILWPLIGFRRRGRHANAASARYGLLARLLHWVALEPLTVRRMAFELDRQFSLGGESFSVAADEPVFICGVARSGTTTWLNLLSNCNNLRSLTYRDMPFVLAPNLWRVCNGRAVGDERFERAHGDGILVGPDSPESFEEVFWRTFGNSVEEPSDLPSFAEQFTAYRAMVANPKRGPRKTASTRFRYLSKNNGNLSRISLIASITHGTILVIFRDPCATARSLLRQHVNFSCLGREDRYINKYMDWLGHSEFGPNHVALSDRPSAELSSLDYWLELWIRHYEQAVNQTPNVIFVDHDQLCIAPDAYFRNICSSIGVAVPESLSLAELVGPLQQGSEEGFSPGLISRARALHGRLIELSSIGRAAARNSGHEQ